VIDSHCHLADEAFAADLADVVGRAQAAGVARALCILSADEPAEVARASVVRAAWPVVEFAAAIHPHRAAVYAGRADAAATVTAAAIDQAGGRAVGEIGLDYHYDFAPRDVQRDVFGAQIALALDRDLPVVIHTREAADDTFSVLREAGQHRLRGVMHCFSGTVDEARKALDLGFYISLAGIVTFPRGENVRDLARIVPADRLLVETDAPFLAPVPFRGKRNEPAWVVRTIEAVAAARGEAVEALVGQLARNFSVFLGDAA
jgi:TatD DNase family protein